MHLETTPVPTPGSLSAGPVLPSYTGADATDEPRSPSRAPTAIYAVSVAGQPDADLDRLGDRIAELAARIQAAACALLVLIRQFDEQGGWRPGGFSS